jgi:hypothetical protein
MPRGDMALSGHRACQSLGYESCGAGGAWTTLVPLTRMTRGVAVLCVFRTQWSQSSAPTVESLNTAGCERAEARLEQECRWAAR